MFELTARLREYTLDVKQKYENLVLLYETKRRETKERREKHKQELCRNKDNFQSFVLHENEIRNFIEIESPQNNPDQESLQVTFLHIYNK